jgi:bacterioferritin-associated ferredoxin
MGYAQISAGVDQLCGDCRAMTSQVLTALRQLIYVAPHLGFHRCNSVTGSMS